MSGKKLADAVTELSDSFYEEAAELRPRRRTPRWVLFTAAAACLALAFFAFSGSPTDIDTPAPPEPQALEISLAEVNVNEVSGLVDAAPRLYSPELYDEIVWGAQEITEYYARELAPSYIPDWLSPARGNGTATIYAEKSGEVIYDSVYLSYYHGYYADGSPLVAENNACRGFTVTASRLGIVRCCLYLHDNEDTTDIAGTPVTFGYCEMPHGPYDPETHEPAGYYDLYTANFTLDGIEFEIIAEQMELSELIQITASIIAPAEEIAITE